MALLTATAISKSFAGVQALKSVSFELRAGEVHALLGENGAGKSTLIKVMTGAVTADSGTLTIDGAVVAHNTPALARSLGVAAVYQQPALFPDLTVAENIALALEGVGLWRKVDWKARDRQARELLERTGAEISPGRAVSTLSMPEQQIVEIAKAIGARSKILILDEPTASLTEREVERLFRVIQTLRGEGAGIVYISHRLDEVAAIADRVTVLRDGHSIATRELREVDRAELIRLMVGRDIHAIFPKREVPIGEIVLETRGLYCRASGVRDVTLAVRRGEILGVAGLVGSGRTELAETLFGLTPADGGEILVRGQAVRIESPAEAIRHRIGYLPEDRRQHGVVLEMPVAANTSLASLSAISKHGLIDEGAERSLARNYVDRLRIKTHSLYAETGSLSGGNQQKVALARWLATEPEVLILDEPTQGVDIGSKSEIHEMMVNLAEQGLAIVMISSELPEILGMSDRIAVMHGGTMAGILTRAEATQEKILAMALGARLMFDRHLFERHRREFSLVIAILALGAVLAVVAPGFFTFANQRDLVLANMPVLIVALGMVLVILTGQIDISVGSQFAICSVATGVFARMGLPTPLAGAAACVLGAMMGAINGALVAWVRIPAIVVTLATMVALRDGLRWVTQGAWVENLPPEFQWFGQSQMASEAITIGCALALTVGVSWGLRNLAAGRVVYATGSDANAARLAGVNPSRVIFAVFVITGALTGFAAVFNAVRFHQIPSNAGMGLELKVIAAAVVGGVSISGGRGTIGGTMLGLLLLGVIGPALTFLGLSAYWERAIEGGIILAAVSMDAIRAHSEKYGNIVGAQRA